VNLVCQYPDTPIYHYGSYEPRALATLAKRYHTDSEHLTTRLVNVNRYIYGKVYFPVRSNRLKDIGHFIGAAWTSPDASGLQSLVWRHQWEQTQEAQYRELLVTYNREDCQALKALTDELAKIQHSADTLSEIDFVHQPKQHVTEIGKEVHSQFDAILRFAHFSYDKKKISFHQATPNHPSQHEGKEKKKYASHIAHQKRENTKLKATKTVQVPREKVCPECGYVPLHPRKQIAERTIIDLVLTRNGVRKTLTRYVGAQGYCRQCRKLYSPPDIRKYERQQVYGNGFKSWIVYHRIALRLPYQSILETVQEYFHEKLSISRFPDLIQSAGKFYAATEEALIQRLLESPFIHADETPINIEGVNQYVWTFTDGQYVVFKFTETREATIVHEFLVDYHGVLISDFYPGYDSVRCRQQKCWVHLIRDLNDDLWGAPFDTEFETFILEVRNLIVPILEAIQKDGRQQRHLHTFQKQVDLFYEEIILNQHYHSELVLKYQNRFIQYRASLFTFLEYDGIPWENNTAERALRHLTVQEKISGSFSPSLMPDYLRLLAMRQRCRFQGKSFFQFLFSGETDLDKFASHKRKR